MTRGVDAAVQELRDALAAARGPIAEMRELMPRYRQATDRLIAAKKRFQVLAEYDQEAALHALDEETAGELTELIDTAMRIGADA